MSEGGAAGGAAAETGADGAAQRHAPLSGGRESIGRRKWASHSRGYGEGYGREEQQREMWGVYKGGWTEEIKELIKNTGSQEGRRGEASEGKGNKGGGEEWEREGKRGQHTQPPVTQAHICTKAAVNACSPTLALQEPNLQPGCVDT